MTDESNGKTKNDKCSIPWYLLSVGKDVSFLSENGPMIPYKKAVQWQQKDLISPRQIKKPFLMDGQFLMEYDTQLHQVEWNRTQKVESNMLP